MYVGECVSCSGCYHADAIYESPASHRAFSILSLLRTCSNPLSSMWFSRLENCSLIVRLSNVIRRGQGVRVLARSRLQADRSG